MNRIILPFLVLSLLSSCKAIRTRSSVEGIAGEDDRKPSKWPQIGFLGTHNENAPGCTATLVGIYTILTAQHCVAGGYLFRLPSGVTARVKSVLASGVKDRKFANEDEEQNFRQTHRHQDWALLELDRPLGITPPPTNKLGGFGYLRLAPLERIDDPLILVGFPSDLGQGHKAQVETRHCKVQRLPVTTKLGTIPDSGVFRHDCDAWGGSSGGPFLHETADHHFEIVGIHVAGERKHREEGDPMAKIINGGILLGDASAFLNQDMCGSPHRDLRVCVDVKRASLKLNIRDGVTVALTKNVAHDEFENFWYGSTTYKAVVDTTGVSGLSVANPLKTPIAFLLKENDLRARLLYLTSAGSWRVWPRAQEFLLKWPKADVAL